MCVRTHTDTHTHRHRHTQTHIHTDRQTDRQTETDTHTYSIYQTDDGMPLVVTSDCTVQTHWHMVLLTEVFQHLCGMGVACRRRAEGFTSWDAGMSPHGFGGSMHHLGKEVGGRGGEGQGEGGKGKGGRGRSIATEGSVKGYIRPHPHHWNEARSGHTHITGMRLDQATPTSLE